MRPTLVRISALTFLVACEGAPAANVRPTPPPDPRPEPARDPSRRCAVRAAPPEVIAGGELSEVDLSWSGTHFGIAWIERADGERAVRFTRVRGDGTRAGPPLRVSDPRSEAESPSVAWNGEHWVVVWSGGPREPGDLYQARIDARGSAASRPWRMTRDARIDLRPRIVSTAQGFGLAWVARLPGQRWALYAQALDRFDTPRAEPARLIETAVTLSETSLVWTGTHWAAAALASRREVLAVSFARLDARGFPLGGLARLTPASLGGIETRGRYALAWDGSRYAIAWSEVREGASHIYLARADSRVRAIEPPQDLREGIESADAPALCALGNGAVAAAWLVSREGRTRLRVRVIDADGRLQEDPIEVQDHDGAAGPPRLSVGGDVLAVVSMGARALTFHRVMLGPCPAPLR